MVENSRKRVGRKIGIAAFVCMTSGYAVMLIRKLAPKYVTVCTEYQMDGSKKEKAFHKKMFDNE